MPEELIRKSWRDLREDDVIRHRTGDGVQYHCVETDAEPDDPERPDRDWVVWVRDLADPGEAGGEYTPTGESYPWTQQRPQTPVTVVE